MTPTALIIEDAKRLCKVYGGASEATRVLTLAGWFTEKGLDRWERERREDVRGQLELMAVAE